MKTCFVYGAAMAILGALINVVLFLLGYHSDPERLARVQAFVSALALVIAVGCIIFGTRARREELGPNAAFGYGRALGVGLLIGSIGSVLGSLFNVIYVQWINPGFTDVQIQFMVSRWEAAGVADAAISRLEAGARTMLQPGLQFLTGVVGGIVLALIASLITAAFVKRPAPTGTPPVLPT